MAFVLGGLLLATSLFGGGIEVREVKIPKIGAVSRILSAIVGLGFVYLSLTLAPKGTQQDSVDKKQVLDVVPNTCINGMVWREAVPNDFVCVTSSWRKKTKEENVLGPSLRQPRGGPYNLDTCKQGFVWRETQPSDHVCVTPQSRKDNLRINKGDYTPLG
jgi:hypothetical protein